jgi:23S rRNA pseudouridine2605 synthase
LQSRLNKVIAASGICSRRDADELISAGHVKVNGKLITELGTIVNADRDLIRVNGRPLPSKPLEYVALHKPRGVITSCEDEKNRTCVLDLLPDDLKHLRPVGRLDRDSSGLLVMTNDGALIYALTHPSKEIGKTYKVTVAGKVTKAQVNSLATGVLLDDRETNDALVRVLELARDQSVLEIVLYEGRNRQIRRMCSHVGLPVLRLVRVAVGGLQLGGLKPGGWRILKSAEIKLLQKAPKTVEGQ